ncbi:MAG: serine hydrolase, partial [Planctomycetes bacterium]|nr:serine hydrolase [Planctomycetota bacterium]
MRKIKEELQREKEELQRANSQGEQGAVRLVAPRFEAPNRFVPLPRATPEEEGVSSADLAAAIKKLTELEYVHGFVVLHGGYVIAEGYRTPWRADVPHMLFSASKSFTAIAVGRAELDGRLALDAPLVKFFPEIVDGNPKVGATMRRVTLRHLLTMASGHDHCLMAEMMAAPDGDYARVFLETAPKFAPGTRFVYNTGASYMLAAVVRRATGQNVGDYLAPRLFNHLDIADWRWDKCPRGTDLGGYGLYLRTEDLAKFAELMRHKGGWGARRLHLGFYAPNAVHGGYYLLPEAFVVEATRKQIDTGNGGGYGYQFWIGPDGSFQASGMCGQFALVLPQAE